MKPLRVHLISHNDLRSLTSKASDVDLWCYLSAIRLKLWKWMAAQDHVTHAWSEILIIHLEQSECIVEAEIASRRLLSSLPKG